VLLRSLPAVVALITSVRKRRSIHASSGARAEPPYSRHLPRLSTGALTSTGAIVVSKCNARPKVKCVPPHNRLDLEQSGAFARGAQIASCLVETRMPFRRRAMRAVTVRVVGRAGGECRRAAAFQLDQGVTPTRGQWHDSITD
jgi:hypothetical protein